jgi:hypothetical protein
METAEKLAGGDLLGDIGGAGMCRLYGRDIIESET